MRIKSIYKNTLLLLVIIVTSVALSGCLVKKQLMDRPAADNNYHYENADLGFTLVLPPEFIYYQTQRTENNGATELAIFVPTSDTTYQQEVAGYGKPISVMIYSSEDWNNLAETYKNNLTIVGEKNKRLYAMQFWQKAPDDWKDKWNEQMKEKIIQGFKME